MNAKTIIATIALTLGAAPGFASAASAMNDAAPAMSRVEVRQDLANFPVASEATEAYSTVVPVSTLSRADVLADLQVARASGKLQNVGEAYGSFQPSQVLSTKQQADVRADIKVGLSRLSLDNYLGA